MIYLHSNFDVRLISNQLRGSLSSFDTLILDRKSCSKEIEINNQDLIKNPVDTYTYVFVKAIPLHLFKFYRKTFKNKQTWFLVKSFV